MQKGINISIIYLTISSYYYGVKGSVSSNAFPPIIIYLYNNYAFIFLLYLYFNIYMVIPDKQSATTILIFIKDHMKMNCSIKRKLYPYGIKFKY